MTKQIIRLTESDLHNIINEAVKIAITEMDKQGYDTAMQNHPNLMNKIRPETFNKHAVKASDEYLVGRSRAKDPDGFDNDRKRYVDPLLMAAAQEFTKDGRKNIGDGEELNIVPSLDTLTQMLVYHSRYSTQKTPSNKQRIWYDSNNDMYETWDDYRNRDFEYTNSKHLRNDNVKAFNKKIKDITDNNTEFGRQIFREPE